MSNAVLIDYGCHSFTYRLAAHLDDQGLPIRYFANGSLESPNRSSLDEWTRCRPSMVRSVSCRKPYGKLSLHKRLLGELEWAKHCTAALEAEKPSVILLSCVPLAAVTRIQSWARRHSTPIIYWLQDLQGRAIHDLLGRKLGVAGKVLGAFAYLWEQEVLERSRMVITIARDHERELPASVRLQQRHQLLENWADLENFPQYPLKNDWAVRNGLHETRNILYSGTLGIKHDLGLFLDLARHFQNQSDVRVVIVSSGQAADVLRARAASQGLDNLIVLPFQPYEDVPKVLASASILVAPLDTSAGSFCVPSKILSYFCAARPTVIAIDDTNPAAVIIRKIGAGSVVRPGDSEAFIGAVADLLNNEELRHKAGCAGRSYAEASFALKNVADRFLSILARSDVQLFPRFSADADVAAASLVLTTDAQPASINVSKPVGTIAALLLCDLGSTILSLLAAWMLRNAILHTWQNPDWSTILAAVVLVLCGLTGAGLYPAVTVNPVEELRRSTLSITLGFLALLSTTFLLRDLSGSRLVYVLAYILIVVLVPFSRGFVRAVFASRPWWGCTAAILGYGSTGRAIYKSLMKNPGIGLKPVAILDDDLSLLEEVDTSVGRGPLALCKEITKHRSITYGIVCMPNLSKEELLKLVDRYEHCFGHLIIIPNLIGMTSLGISATEVGGVIGLEVTRQLLRPSARFAKRALDVVLAILIAPFVAAVVAIAAVLIKLEDGGPAFYASNRVGFRGRTFRVWKLRSMVIDAEQKLADYLAAHPNEAEAWHLTQKLKRDPRVTKVGRVIRKTSIDELPQLWNVLVGEMSVVGPRPVLAQQVPLYGPSFELYKQVRPGITGLWQVSGRNHLSFAERVMLDKYVIQNWSVWLDLYILGCTANVVLTTDGAY